MKGEVEFLEVVDVDIRVVGGYRERRIGFKVVD